MNKWALRVVEDTGPDEDMKGPIEYWRHMTPVKKDIILICIFILIFYSINTIFDIFYFILVFIEKHTTGMIDDIITVGLVLIIGLALFSYRRWKEVESEIRERMGVENALRLSYKKLDLLNTITRHDILNNLTALSGYLELSQQGIRDPEFFSVIEKCKMFVRIISEQITFTRLYQEIGLKKPAWQDLGRILEGLVPPAGITLVNHVKDVEILADSMFEKVFSNLLDNAARHGTRVTLISVSLQQRSDSLRIIWEDNGVGIPKDEKEKIFEHGYGKNTGLGLFLIREILSISSITIHECGEPGTGARFEIIVPGGGFRVSQNDEDTSGAAAGIQVSGGK